MASAKCPICDQTCHELGARLELQKVLGHELAYGKQWPHLARVVRSSDGYHLSEIRLGSLTAHQVVKTSAEMSQWYATFQTEAEKRRAASEAHLCRH